MQVCFHFYDPIETEVVAILITFSPHPTPNNSSWKELSEESLVFLIIVLLLNFLKMKDKEIIHLDIFC